MLLKIFFLQILIHFSQTENPFCNSEKTFMKIENGTLETSGCGNRRVNLGAEKLSLMKLLAKFNRIERLAHTDLEGAHNLLEIDLRFNELQIISCRAFTDQTELVLLKLDANKLNILSSGTQDPLVKLEELTLSRNKLHIIEKSLFRYNQNLKRIDLNDNAIFAISPNILDGINKNFNVSLLNFACSFHEKSLHSIEDFKKHYNTCMENYDSYFKNAKFFSDCTTKETFEMDQHKINESEKNSWTSYFYQFIMQVVIMILVSIKIVWSIYLVFCNGATDVPN